MLARVLNLKNIPLEKLGRYAGADLGFSRGEGGGGFSKILWTFF